MDENIHKGHRKRIDEKSALFGLEFMEEHEQLEKLLFAVIPRGNTNIIAHDLLDKFGTLYGVLTADVDRLQSVEGVGSRCAKFLHDLMPLLGIVERSIQSEPRLILDTTEKVGAYTKTLFYGKVTESLYMISLNSALHPTRYDKISEGTATSTDVSLIRLAKQAVLNDAHAVVLAHNHPGGRLFPSEADLYMTHAARDALKSLNIALADHIIVACGKWYSILKNKGEDEL